MAKEIDKQRDDLAEVVEEPTTPKKGSRRVVTDKKVTDDEGTSTKVSKADGESKQPETTSDEALPDPAIDRAGYTIDPAEDAAVNANRRRKNKRLAIGAGAAVVTVAALTLLAFGVLIYAYKSENPVVANVAQVIPYPVARVNGHFVSYSDYLFQLNANQRGYQQNAKLNNQPAVDYKTAEGKKIMTQFRTASLDKVKSDAVIAQLAAQKKVVVTTKDENALIDELYKNYGGKDTLLKTLKDIYGWNLNDLRSVVHKQLLEQKLSDKVTSDPAVDAQAKAKAADVAAKLKDNGDFAALAKQYSQASDAASGGDLGSFTKGQVSDEIQKAADSLDVNGVSAPFKDKYGYEIVKVTEKNGDTTRASHILIKTVDFTDYLDKQIKQAKYNQYIKV